jgi:hypothetical protein
MHAFMVYVHTYISGCRSFTFYEQGDGMNVRQTIEMTTTAKKGKNRKEKNQQTFHHHNTHK